MINIEGYTAIEKVVNNLKPLKYIDEIILATSANIQDDSIENIANRKNILFFRVDENDVVKRFIDVTKKFSADIVVRVTGDCLLVSFEMALYLINSHLEKGADYSGIETDEEHRLELVRNNYFFRFKKVKIENIYLLILNTRVAITTNGLPRKNL